jgi:hypothetical protein
MSTSGSSVQFNGVNPSSFDPNHRMGVEIGREAEQELPAPLQAQNMASADAATAWRVRKSGKPLPYSKRTMGSLYDFSKD